MLNLRLDCFGRQFSHPEARPPSPIWRPAGALPELRAELAKAEKNEPVAQGRGQDSYIDRFREFKYRKTLYELFVRQYELARVDEAREGAVIQLVDIAQPPERKSEPEKAMIAMVASLAAGMAMLLFVFVRQSLRNAAQHAESAQKLGQLKAAWRRALERGARAVDLWRKRWGHTSPPKNIASINN